MTPADCCGQCRSIHICRQKCGVTPAATPERTPAPAITERQPGIGVFGALVILGGVAAFALPFADLLGRL
jgi:hypothetical protein